MARTISPEARKKMQQAQRDKMAQRGRVLRVGKFLVYKFDEYNYALDKDIPNPKPSRCYYPDFPTAVQGLYRKLLDDGSSRCKELSDVVSLVKKTEEKILAAVKEYCR